MISLIIEKSKGFTKDGRKKIFIRPEYYCFNKSRFATGIGQAELEEAKNNIIRKWYSPNLLVYTIDSHTIVSNNEKNALTEYWRVCERNKIGKLFKVTLNNL